uniref:Uncharacterized protein n=1 Tax=Triticum urartu TaxID=4572 RepID=A0A8R7UY49_TRIUA
MRRAAAARKQRPGPWIYYRGLLLRLPGRAAALLSGDSDQPARDKERKTTVTCRRHKLDLAGDDAAPHKELSVSPVPWTVTTGIPPSSLIARSSAPTTMIPHRTRYDCIVGYLVLSITINMTYP